MQEIVHIQAAVTSRSRGEPAEAAGGEPEHQHVQHPGPEELGGRCGDELQPDVRHQPDAPHQPGVLQQPGRLRPLRVVLSASLEFNCLPLNTWTNGGLRGHRPGRGEQADDGGEGEAPGSPPRDV